MHVLSTDWRNIPMMVRKGSFLQLYKLLIPRSRTLPLDVVRKLHISDQARKSACDELALARIAGHSVKQSSRASVQALRGSASWKARPSRTTSCRASTNSSNASGSAFGM
jgi:hypothetical protein